MSRALDWVWLAAVLVSACGGASADGLFTPGDTAAAGASSEAGAAGSAAAGSGDDALGGEGGEPEEAGGDLNATGGASDGRSGASSIGGKLSSSGGAAAHAGAGSGGAGGAVTGHAGTGGRGGSGGTSAAAGGGGTSAGGTGGAGAGGLTMIGGNGPVSCSWIYRDSDQDGFGDPAAAIQSCFLQAGYVANSDDCYDKNAFAYPGSKIAMAKDRGDGSFDYDCNGVQDLTYPGYADCTGWDNACPPPPKWPSGFTCDYDGMVKNVKSQAGWAPGTTIPACGKSGDFGLEVYWAAPQYICLPPTYHYGTYQTCH